MYVKIHVSKCLFQSRTGLLILFLSAATFIWGIPENKYELWGYIKSNINVRKTPASRTMNLKYVNFLACILLASDWFKDNQLLSQLTHAHYRDTVPLKRGIWHHRHRLLANGLDTMFFCYSSFKIFASLMTVSVKSCAVLSSRFDINIFGWLFFRFVFCDKNRSKYSLHYNSWPTISFEENRANHQGYLFFDLTSTWVGKGRTLPAALMFSIVFCHLEHLWENLWQANTIWFSYFSLSTGDTVS